MLDLHDIPRPHLLLNKSPLDAYGNFQIESLQVARCLNAPTALTVQISSDTLHTPEVLGAEISLSIGAERTPVFEGTVSGLNMERDGADTRRLTLTAYDALDRLRHNETPRSFTEMSTLDILRAVCRANGLNATGDDPGPQWPQVLHLGSSDLSFLRRLAARGGQSLWYDGIQVNLIPTAPDTRAERVDCDTGVVSVRMETRAVAHRAATRVSGWDSTTGTLLNASTNTRDPIDAPSREEVRSGLALAGQRTLHREALAAQTLSDAHAKVIELEVIGAPWHAPGTTISVFEAGKPLSSPRRITTTTLTLDPTHGLRGIMSTRPVPFPPEPSMPQVSPATIASVADPERLGRVQVSLDTADQVLSGWLRVLLPAAGARKGFIALPDVGDRVALLHTGPNAEGALVLGGLLGEAGRDMGVSGKRVTRYKIHTIGGLELVLDDEAKTLTLSADDGAKVTLARGETKIEAPNGSHLTMGRRNTILHAQTDLTIEAPGRDIEIAAKSIDFRKR